jgi:hypothetical protein
MGDFATLDEIRNATAGTTFVERRYTPGGLTIRQAGSLVEHRTAAQIELHLAVLEGELAGLPWWEARIRALERQGEELWA